MPYPLRAPNTIYLGGGDGPAGQFGYTPVVDMLVLGTPLPGYLAEVRVDSGVRKWAVHSAGGADADVLPVAFFLEQTEMGLGTEDAYKTNSLCTVAEAHPGSIWWIMVATGQNIALNGILQSNGDGLFKAVGTGKGILRALESTGGATAAPTRIRAEVIRVNS